MTVKVISLQGIRANYNKNNFAFIFTFKCLQARSKLERKNKKQICRVDAVYERPLFDKNTMRDWYARNNASYCGLNIKNMEKNSLKRTKRNLKRRWPFVRCRQVLDDSKAVRHRIRPFHLQMVLPCKKICIAKKYALHVLACIGM